MVVYHKTEAQKRAEPKAAAFTGNAEVGCCCLELQRTGILRFRGV